MKKLEELGISPTPWTLHERSSTCNFVMNYGDQYRYISAGGNTNEKECVAAFKIKKGVCIKYADANLLTAAPDLYDAAFKTEAVLEKLFTLDEFAALLKSGAADALIACREELRSALAKASGEGEV